MSILDLISFMPTNGTERPGPSTAWAAVSALNSCRHMPQNADIGIFVAENVIRPLALNRKNALFAGHDEGGAAWARIATLTETAKMNDVNPYAYLKSTLEAISNGHPASDIDQLLPWAFTPASS